jgi:D-alanyl-D-alanine endopeptidase (penicillin-binding protein 7)
MLKKIFFLTYLILISICLLLAKNSQASTVEQLNRNTEIIKQELNLIQSLLANMNSSQEISASGFIAVNLSNNYVLLEKNPQRLFPIASITKMMTAVIVLENIEAQKNIILTEEMLKPLGNSPSLYRGLSVSASNLLKASLIQSSNDAAQALSYFIGNKKFVQLMNQKAKELGMINTVFYDVHGLSPLNRSTPLDLVKLLAYIHKNHAEIFEITKNNNFWLPDKKGNLLKFQNVNNFYPLSSFLGGKAGYLPEAKQTMAGVFNIKGNPVAIVVLNSKNQQADVFSILRQLENEEFWRTSAKK